MSKDKLKRFSELESFQRVFQPEFNEFFSKDYKLKGEWASEVFKNSNPIVLELGCGKGEYTIAQARMFPEKNFIGVDIKGARIWRGAKTANEESILNAAFLRTRIEFIKSFFAKDEIDEIWITFPDPQLKRRRNKKRLTSSFFLNRYMSFLRANGIINLKTDNGDLFNYTRDIAIHNQLRILTETNDLYNSDFINETLAIKTYYERRFLNEGSAINFISFRLPNDQQIIETSNHE